MSWDLFPAPGVIKQGDGSRYQWLNCAAATAAMHVMSERQGKRPAVVLGPWPPTAASFRAATGDTSGGLSAAQTDATANRLYGVDPDVQIATADMVASKLRAGFGVSFSHSHGPIADAGFSGAPGFRGSHSAFLSALRASQGVRTLATVKDCDPLFDGRRSGIPRGPQWIPWPVIVKAGELLVIGDNGDRMIDRYGPGKLLVAFTRIPYRPAAAAVTLRYSVAFSGASFWTYPVVNGVIVGPRKSRAFGGPTSAPCSAPAVYPTPGSVSRRLVRITAGVLKGEFVAVPQGAVRLIETEVKA